MIAELQKHLDLALKYELPDMTVDTVEIKTICDQRDELLAGLQKLVDGTEKFVDSIPGLYKDGTQTIGSKGLIDEARALIAKVDSNG